MNRNVSLNSAKISCFFEVLPKIRKNFKCNLPVEAFNPYTRRKEDCCRTETEAGRTSKGSYPYVHATMTASGVNKQFHAAFECR